MDIAHMELCKRQSADNRYSYWKNSSKSGHEFANEISGTTELHGPLRRIELDSVDSERFLRKRNRWCLTSDRIAKGS